MDDQVAVRQVAITGAITVIVVARSRCVGLLAATIHGFRALLSALRSLGVAALALPDWLVEIEAIAVI
jgi:hypothetical protein